MPLASLEYSTRNKIPIHLLLLEILWLEGYEKFFFSQSDHLCHSYSSLSPIKKKNVVTIKVYIWD